MNDFKKISQNINEISLKNINGKKIKWINISNARKKEIEYLRKNFQFNLSHLRSSSAVAKNQRPTVDETEDYLFVILHFPIIRDDFVKSQEIDFFVGKDYIITLHNNIKTLNDFFKFCMKDGLKSISTEIASTSDLLHEIIEKLMMDCYIILDDNSETLEELEEMIFSQESKDAVSNILILRRNIINTRKALQNHKNIIQNLINIELEINPETDIEEKYQGLLLHSNKIWETLQNHKEMVEILNETNESLMNHRLNEIMKTLTIFSVIVFPLSLLAGIFGMNVDHGMPFIGIENGFWIIILMMLTGCIGMLIYFKKRRWM